MMDLEVKRTGNQKILVEKMKNGVVFFEFPILNRTKKIKHMFTSRIGGVSEGVCKSLNLSFSRGDDENAVRENFNRIAAILEEDVSNFVFTDQTHTDCIRRVYSEDKGKGITKKIDYKDVDGLITNEKGVVLSTFFADCVPLFFFDVNKEVIALVHSGWKGTVLKIATKAIDEMVNEFGSDKKDIVGAVGPSICQKCYEVSEDVISQFKENYDSRYWDQLFYSTSKNKYQLNLWKANEIQMLEAGLLPENIEVTDICTCCNPDILFSHRATGGKRGNLAAFLTLV